MTTPYGSDPRGAYPFGYGPDTQMYGSHAHGSRAHDSQAFGLVPPGAPGLPGTAVPTDGPVPPVVRPRRGRGLATFCLVSAVVVAAVFGLTGFYVLDSVDLTAGNPFGEAFGWLLLFGLTGVAAVVVVLLAIVAVFRCRPRGVAVVALLAGIALPVVAVVLAVTFGVDALQRNAVAALGADTGVAADALDVLEAWGVPVAPVRDLLRSVGGG